MMHLRSITRAALLGLSLAGGIGAVAVGTPACAQANARDPAAEDFVQSHARGILGMIGNGRSVHGAAFNAAIENMIDVPRVTRFVLGKYARTVTPDQYQRFAAAFKTYAEGVYEKRLGDFSATKLVATGSQVRKPGDVLVTTAVSQGGGGAPVVVTWRVLGTGGDMKVVDLNVGGVWLGITQQQDFVSTIDNNGGRIDVLINQLQQDATTGSMHGKGK